MTAALAVGVALLGIMPGSAAIAQSEPPVSVAGTTVLVGDSSASLPVSVPADAVIDLTPEPDGEGRLAPRALETIGGHGHVGFVLTERGTSEGLAVVALGLPEPLVDGDRVSAAVGHGTPAEADRPESQPIPIALERPSCERCRVPAGEYDLYLITRGPDTQVRIFFEGLDGVTTLAPSSPVGTFTAGFTLSVNGPPSPSGGASIGMSLGWDPPTAGLLFNTYDAAAEARLTPVVATAADACRWIDEDRDCDPFKLGAGAHPHAAGSAAMSGDTVNEIAAAVSLSKLGDATYQVGLTMLWIRTGHGSTGMGDPSPECFMDLGLGVDLVDSHCS